MSSFKELFKPGRIGGMEIRNRIVMPSMSTGYSGDGYASERMRDYYEERARGGVGLIIVEANCIESRARRWSDRLLIDDDKYIPRLLELTEAIHRHGAKVAQQIGHGGRTIRSSFTGVQPVAPSPIPEPGGEVPHELTVAEIREIVGHFAQAADRAKRAGFDAVEVHGAHTNLITQFLMPSSNQRKDEYGGELKNRARFMLEVVKAIRLAVGPDYPFWCRIDGEENGFMGITPLEELQELVRMLQESGVDAINVSGVPYCRPYFSTPAYFVNVAAAVKQVVRIPVIVAGWITPEVGESVLKQGKADFIGMGRPLIADPQFPNKVAAGNMEDITPCIRCLECINTLGVKFKPIPCAVNARAGREREYQITPAGKKKKVLVVGGGPAGMEAARVAALRGHDVTLCERGRKLGGAMLILSVVRGVQGGDLIVALTRYLETQIRKLGVKVRLGREVNEALIKEIMPDVAILATGGIAADPEIPGINKPIVLSQSDLHRMVKPYLRIFGPKALRWLTKFYLPIGKRVIIIGGGIQGIELADFLVTRGRKVTVTETSDELGTEMPKLVKEPLLESLARHSCTLLSGVKYGEITDKGLALVTGDGRKQTIEADTIIPAMPLKPNTDLFEALKGKIPEIYLIGDAREPHLILEAVSEGLRTALTI